MWCFKALVKISRACHMVSIIWRKILARTKKHGYHYPCTGLTFLILCAALKWRRRASKDWAAKLQDKMAAIPGAQHSWALECCEHYCGWNRSAVYHCHCDAHALRIVHHLHGSTFHCLPQMQAQCLSHYRCMLFAFSVYPMWGFVRGYAYMIWRRPLLQWPRAESCMLIRFNTYA